MCGITAYFDLVSTVDTPPPDLAKSLSVLNHRGPDGHGVWAVRGVGLGHARLSIMDVAHGAQPMHSDHVHVIVNGEFYNFESIRQDLVEDGHTFETHSDSEILLYLYKEFGIDCLRHLQGEFAFVLYDSRIDRLFVVRDRYGVKPLYYTILSQRLLIASEIKAFLAMGWKAQWDLASISCSAYSMDNVPTVFQGVSKVRPGHYMTVSSSGSINFDPYYTLSYPDKSVKDPRTHEEMVLEVRARLMEAVRCRLRSDVPLAVYLSGGIDSSAILGLAASIRREADISTPIHAFTIAFDDKPIDGVLYNENSIAEATAKHVGAEFHSIQVSEKDMTDAFEETIWHLESPTLDMNSTAKFLLSKHVRNAGFKVVLTGEGADEHFAGYSLLMADFVREPTIPPCLPEPIRLGILNRIEDGDPRQWSSIGCVPMSFTDQPLARSMLNNISASRIVSTAAGLPPQLFKVPNLVNTAENHALTLSGLDRELAKTKWHPLHTALCVIARGSLPNGMIAQLGDRVEMANSIEGRLPFLDHRLTTYVNGLPPQVKIRFENGGLIDKWILRQAVQPYVTEQVYKRPKMPFLAPPAPYNPNNYHWKKIQLKVTKSAVEYLGWMDWSFVEEKKQAYMKLNDRQALNILNQVMGFIVLQEKFQVATWQPRGYGTPHMDIDYPFKRRKSLLECICN